MKWTSTKKDFEMAADAMSHILRNGKDPELVKKMIGEQIGRLRSLIHHFPEGDGNDRRDPSVQP